MKKIFWTIAIATIILGFTPANAAAGKTGKDSRKQLRREKREARKELWLHSVNRITAQQFYTDFPKAKNVCWMETAFSEATFDDGTIHKTAYYDLDNELVGTTTLVDGSAIPTQARHEIGKKYRDYKIEKVILFDDNEANDTDMYLFGHAFEDEDTYFAVLNNDQKKIVLKISTDGLVSFFHDYN